MTEQEYKRVRLHELLKELVADLDTNQRYGTFGVMFSAQAGQITTIKKVSEVTLK